MEIVDNDEEVYETPRLDLKVQDSDFECTSNLPENSNRSQQNNKYEVAKLEMNQIRIERQQYEKRSRDNKLSEEEKAKKKTLTAAYTQLNKMLR